MSVGVWPGTLFQIGYFECDDDPGTVTEIVYLDANVRGMFANIKAQTF